jgi:hypothetical protein
LRRSVLCPSRLFQRSSTPSPPPGSTRPPWIELSRSDSFTLNRPTDCFNRAGRKETGCRTDGTFQWPNPTYTDSVGKAAGFNRFYARFQPSQIGTLTDTLGRDWVTVAKMTTNLKIFVLQTIEITSWNYIVPKGRFHSHTHIQDRYYRI